MKLIRITARRRRHSIVLIESVLFLPVFSKQAVSMSATAGADVEPTSNYHTVNSTQTAAETSPEYGQYIITNTTLPSATANVIPGPQTDQARNTLDAKVQVQSWINRTTQPTGGHITITPMQNTYPVGVQPQRIRPLNGVLIP